MCREFSGCWIGYVFYAQTVRYGIWYLERTLGMIVMPSGVTSRTFFLKSNGDWKNNIGLGLKGRSSSSWCCMAENVEVSD